MKIDHIGMFVKDLEKTKDFFIKYFNAIPNKKYRNAKTKLETYFLSFKDGCRLEIMTKPNLDAHHDLEYQGYHHLAFSVESNEAVDQITNMLKLDGFLILNGPRVTGDGYYEMLFQYENHLIEIVATK